MTVTKWAVLSPHHWNTYAAAETVAADYLKKNGNEWELIGICAEGGIDLAQFMKTYYYGQVMGWTRVSLFADWITGNSR